MGLGAWPWDPGRSHRILLSYLKLYRGRPTVIPVRELYQEPCALTGFLSWLLGLAQGARQVPPDTTFLFKITPKTAAHDPGYESCTRSLKLAQGTLNCHRGR